MKIVLFIVFVVLVVALGGMIRSHYPDMSTAQIMFRYWWVPLLSALVLELIYMHFDLPDDAL